MGCTLKGKTLLLELLQEQILSFKELTPIEKGGKPEDDRSTSTENVPIYLKTILYPDN